MPVVGTPIAFEGSGLAPNDGIMVGEDADTLAQQIVGLHETSQMWNALSQRALERCRALYSREQARGVYRSIMSDLGIGDAG